MIKRIIYFNDRAIEYELTFKNIKSLYSKVEHGVLKVSAPKLCSIDVIEDILSRHQDSILKSIDTYQPYAIYSDGGYITLFDRRYKICLRDVNKKQCAIHDDVIYVYHHDIEKTVELFLKNQLESYINEKISLYQASFGLRNLEVVIKKYKGRWGSCYYKMNKVSFNYYLVYFKKSLIDYVIIHELTHFLYPNHSKLFYQAISGYLPDYRMREKELKGKNI